MPAAMPGALLFFFAGCGSYDVCGAFVCFKDSPHCVQKFLPGVTGAPHLGQVVGSGFGAGVDVESELGAEFTGLPHLGQNFVPSGS
jgi:hypothetical protein